MNTYIEYTICLIILIAWAIIMVYLIKDVIQINKDIKELDRLKSLPESEPEINRGEELLSIVQNLFEIQQGKLVERQKPKIRFKNQDN